jgi:hypothetical protein
MSNPSDRVLGTPPTNTSLSRRAVIVAGALLPIALPAAAGATELPPPDGFERVLDHQGRLWFKADGMPDPAFALIAAKLAADAAHCEAIDAQDEAESGGDADVIAEAWRHCCDASGVVNEADWRLATTPPTTLAGVAAVLRFTNEHEDAGGEWPDTDAIGPEGWHYQLRATMAAALEALLKAQGAKAVQS